jgi:ferredoxin--NADP+ reductase
MSQEQVLEVNHLSDDIFNFKTTRRTPWKNSFKSGQFTTISLGSAPHLKRAYSVASPPESLYLEFLSIKINNGPLTSKLKDIVAGDNIYISDESTGRLVLDNLLPGRILWLLSTGTGLAPFLSIGRNNHTHLIFDRVIVAHTVRTNKDLMYRSELEKAGCEVFQTVTAEETDQHVGRINDYVYNGHLFDYFDLNSFDKDVDRIMLCGNYEFDRELQTMLSDDAWEHGSNNKPGHFVRESAFLGNYISYRQ